MREVDWNWCGCGGNRRDWNCIEMGDDEGLDGNRGEVRENKGHNEGSKAGEKRENIEAYEAKKDEERFDPSVSK